MSLDSRAVDILSRGYYGEPIEAEECAYLLTFREKSPVASLTVTLADKVTHRQSGEVGRIIAEIDVSTGPCPGRCSFCRWSEDTCMDRFEYIEDSVLAGFCERAGGHTDVEEIRLCAIDDTPVDDLAHFVGTARDASRKGTVISIDFGDLDADACSELRRAGASVAYHACRIGEGTATGIKPARRMQTIQNLVDAGFRVTAGTEPIGPETSNKEIVDAFFATLNTDVKHGEVRGREPLPGNPSSGTVSSSRLAQIRAVLTLASAWKSQSAGGVHVAQPYLLGKNVAVAKYTEKEWRAQTEAARRRLFNAGYDRILRPDGSTAEISLAYLKQTGSL